MTIISLCALSVHTLRRQRAISIPQQRIVLYIYREYTDNTLHHYIINLIFIFGFLCTPALRPVLCMAMGRCVRVRVRVCVCASFFLLFVGLSIA